MSLQGRKYSFDATPAFLEPTVYGHVRSPGRMRSMCDLVRQRCITSSASRGSLGEPAGDGVDVNYGLARTRFARLGKFVAHRSETQFRRCCDPCGIAEVKFQHVRRSGVFL